MTKKNKKIKKISKYSYLLNIKGENIIFAAMTNSFAEVSDELMEKLKNNELHLLNQKEREVLEKMKFLASEEEENDFFNKKRFLYYNNNYNVNDLSLAIVPTGVCNFSCFYCFEKDKSKKTMSDETIENVIEFIKSFENKKYLAITWYGGEPLIAFNVIKKIILKLKEKLPEIKITHSLVTNGYLLNKEKIKFFTKYPLANMQITLDGLKERHNNIRFTKNDKNTFDKILSNLDEFFKLNDITQVSIRVNIDKNNVNDYFVLFDLLKKRYKGKKLYVYPAFIENYGNVSQCSLLNRHEQSDFIIENYHKTGFRYFVDTKLQVGGCGATNVKYFIIGSEGELYKCWNDVGNPDKIIGYINSPTITNPQVFYRYISGFTMFDDEKCKNCPIFPICNGGCQWKRIENYYNGANYDLCDVKKDNLDKFLEILYKEAKSKINVKVLDIK